MLIVSPMCWIVIKRKNVCCEKMLTPNVILKKILNYTYKIQYALLAWMCRLNNVAKAVCRKIKKFTCEYNIRRIDAIITIQFSNYKLQQQN